MQYELYLSGLQQREGEQVRYEELDRSLKATGNLKRCLSVDDPMVREWIKNPSTYPEELKKKAVFLWGSQRPSRDGRNVAFLRWHRDTVMVSWSRRYRQFSIHNPVLLRVS